MSTESIFQLTYSGSTPVQPTKWWQEVKHFTGQSTRPSFDATATDLFDGDLSRMDNNFNIFMQSVSSDLKPLDANLIPDACNACPDEYIIDPFEVESKLSRNVAHKSSGSGRAA